MSIQVDTKPSIPSIKFIKFIIADKDIIMKISKIKPKKLFKFIAKNRLLDIYIRMDVTSWIIYFIFGDNEYKSSIKPIMPNGNNKKGMINSLDRPKTKI